MSTTNGAASAVVLESNWVVPKHSFCSVDLQKIRTEMRLRTAKELSQGQLVLAHYSIDSRCQKSDLFGRRIPAICQGSIHVWYKRTSRRRGLVFLVSLFLLFSVQLYFLLVLMLTSTFSSLFFCRINGRSLDSAGI